MRSDQVLVPAADATAAAWIGASIGPFGAGVGSLVPPVFEAYARILHPAWAPGEPAGVDGGSPIRWAAVAAWSGGSVHALAQFEPMSRDRGRSSGPPPFSQPPRTGEPSPAIVQVLAEILASHTATPERCHFGLWEGYGGIAPDGPGNPRLVVPGRAYFLFEGPLGAVADVGWDRNGDFRHESPNLLWPSDRRWFVASEIDLDSTFVGGSRELIETLIADPRLEAWPSHATDPVCADSDPVNGPSIRPASLDRVRERRRVSGIHLRVGPPLVQRSEIRGVGFVIGLLIGAAVAVPFLLSIDATSPDWAVPIVIVPMAGLLGWFAATWTARLDWRAAVVAPVILTPVALMVAALGVVLRSVVAPRSNPDAAVGLALFRDAVLDGPAWVTMLVIVVAWVVAFRTAVRMLALV